MNIVLLIFSGMWPIDYAPKTLSNGRLKVLPDINLEQNRVSNLFDRQFQSSHRNQSRKRSLYLFDSNFDNQN